MNSKNILISISLLLTASVGYIFIAGQLKYQKANSGILNIGFKNSQQLITTPSDWEELEIVIENRNPKESSLLLHYKLDDQEIVKKELLLRPNTTQPIPVPEEIKEKIISSQQKEFHYEISVIWGEKEENIYKLIKLD
jgi:hypothetical protein